MTPNEVATKIRQTCRNEYHQNAVRYLMDWADELDPPKPDCAEQAFKRTICDEPVTNKERTWTDNRVLDVARKAIRLHDEQRAKAEAKPERIEDYQARVRREVDYDTYPEGKPPAESLVERIVRETAVEYGYSLLDGALTLARECCRRTLAGAKPAEQEGAER